MNPNDPRHPWARLLVAARTVRDERDSAAPYGFPSRVAALAFSGERPRASLLERLAPRAVGVACLLALASAAINYSFVKPTTTPDELAASAEDPLSVLLDA